ncbi:hypothetical protein [Nocardiopsis composta]|uniref:Membrane-associated phospholipid phosphatase n=1 Tax=Nocardiopsis composta TaxID=157465 RepID=A0A7W8QSW8_9ACTN|nr:hypothetical protein [Nocardiopsis composta]MBB5435980.1 membrane-associated phospholipid phosphatase [Nocardiopsis composta]
MPAETAAPDRRRGPLGLLARIGTEGLAPAVVVTVLVFGTSWHATGAALPALGWGALAAVFGAAVPMAAILYGVRAGAWTDRHVRRREQRRLPLAVCLGSTAAGTLLMWAAGAPRALVVLVACMAASLVVTWAITERAQWKVSVHSLVAFGAATALSALYGPAAAAAAWPAALLVGWSRVHLGDHTPGQVAVGGLIGAAAMAVFAALG